MVAPFPIAWPTEIDCNRALAHYKSLHLSHRLGLLDAIIGASANGLAATLCTLNAKHYRAVPGLQIEQPYSK
mgnify:CR=1 FL=1